MKAIKQFDADAKFGEVKKYQEDIETLLKGIKDEVNAGGGSPSCPSSALQCWRHPVPMSRHVSPCVDMSCSNARALMVSA